jgi:hypothetical protein
MNDYTFWLGEEAAAYHIPSEEVLQSVAHCLPDGFDLTDPVSDE